MVELEPVEAEEDVEELKGLIQEHLDSTGSVVAEQVLAEWRTDYSRRTEGTRRREEASASTPSPEADQPDERGPKEGRWPKAGHQPRSERQRREEREPKEGRQPSGEHRPAERQSDPRSERGQLGEELSSSRAVPRGRGGARRTRRGSGRQSPGSNQDKS